MLIFLNCRCTFLINRAPSSNVHSRENSKFQIINELRRVDWCRFFTRRTNCTLRASRGKKYTTAVVWRSARVKKKKTLRGVTRCNTLFYMSRSRVSWMFRGTAWKSLEVVESSSGEIKTLAAHTFWLREIVLIMRNCVSHSSYSKDYV